ncbi:MAG: nucleotidyl transferase AbiEii/AbiGii toxin family protein [Candidatus Marinimicrobia bacterium]|nr:nucleotidyl transferase AbiEii/AbiGii toxin family protein [Candidatus Neomarinimicrobiota bacterium]MBL7010438.1 nucleotidyl transferase AbiEii/AbiGii toxin family protein [Candidatus Neomarinimicrobiota bacterium]MBL7030066.1 nucleotidyl transferase AbiEii/AbiGii toxin family protein [Candidatus Neomarinimicrobiota bacterium]
MGHIDYKELYELQDDILASVFAVENEFYLTGGTCLSRFYKEMRYSDDLDFFTHQSGRFSFAVKNIKQALDKKFKIFTEVDSKDFIRFKVDNLLQVDFINDISKRHKDVVVTEENYIIDNVENILSNKITAIMGRDNPKDIFDIYLIHKYYTFSWMEILESAHEKAQFNQDELIIKLKSFPSHLLKSLNIIDLSILGEFDNEFPLVIQEISQH